MRAELVRQSAPLQFPAAPQIGVVADDEEGFAGGRQIVHQLNRIGIHLDIFHMPLPQSPERFPGRQLEFRNEVGVIPERNLLRHLTDAPLRLHGSHAALHEHIPENRKQEIVMQKVLLPHGFPIAGQRSVDVENVILILLHGFRVSSLFRTSVPHCS